MDYRSEEIYAKNGLESPILQTIMCVKDKIIIFPFSVLPFFLHFLQFLGSQTQLHIKFHSLEKKNNNSSQRTLLCLAKIKFFEQWLKALQTKVMVLSFKS